MMEVCPANEYLILKKLIYSNLLLLLLVSVAEVLLVLVVLLLVVVAEVVLVMVMLLLVVNFLVVVVLLVLSRNRNQLLWVRHLPSYLGNERWTLQMNTK